MSNPTYTPDEIEAFTAMQQVLKEYALTMFLQMRGKGFLAEKRIFSEATQALSKRWGIPALRAANMIRIGLVLASGTNNYGKEGLETVLSRAFPQKAAQ